MRRVKFVVRESAQQTCFPDPGISEKQESEENIVLFSHSVGCSVELEKIKNPPPPSQLTQRWMTDPSPPVSHVCYDGQYKALALLLLFLCLFVCLLLLFFFFSFYFGSTDAGSVGNKTGMLQPPRQPPASGGCGGPLSSDTR